MISRCANAACGKGFHYLRGGRLFRFDLRRPATPCMDVPNAICAIKPNHASVFFWLCAECSRRYSIQFSSREGVRTVPLGQRLRQAGPVVMRGAEVE